MNDLDVLIIGSGIAGLCAAIEATQAGAKVSVVTKSIATKSNSVMAQGGINAALGNVKNDSVAQHIEETIEASYGIINPSMVKKLCSEAVDTIEFLEKIGVPFSRLDHANGLLSSIAQRQLAGASVERACYAQDYTGMKILHTLLDKALSLDIALQEGLSLLDFIKNSNNEVCGALFFNMKEGRVETLYAKRVLLTTGGFGSIYAKHTNSKGSSGDGIAAVLRAGGVASNLEFVQFHPTTLKGSNTLISESMRGEGGYLVDSDGERFVDELANRAVVNEAVFKKIQEGKSVYLDIRHLSKEKLEYLIPHELRIIKQYTNIDPFKDLIEIEPAVHYCMGGVATEENFEAVNLKGLFCAGEVSQAGVHGANRLGGNSLTEAAVFGRLAANMALESKGIIIERAACSYALPLTQNADNLELYEKRKSLSKLLFDKVGIIRDASTLAEAKHELNHLGLEALSIDESNLKGSMLMGDIIELKNAGIIAKALIESALWRKESRGAHIRSDYAQMHATMDKESRVRYKDGNMEML